MKKNIKLIIGILIGLVLGVSATVGATALYNSSEVGFTPTDSNWNVNNVEDAINDLYDKANVGVEFGNSSFAKSYGNAITSRSASIELNKGKYIIHAITAVNGGNPSVSSGDAESNSEILHAADNNTTIQKLANHYYKVAASESDIQGNNRWIEMKTASYYVEISAQDDTLSVSVTREWSSNVLPDLISIQAIPIN